MSGEIVPKRSFSARERVPFGHIRENQLHSGTSQIDMIGHLRRLDISKISPGIP